VKFMSTAMITSLMISFSGCGGAIFDRDVSGVQEKFITEKNDANSAPTQPTGLIDTGTASTNLFIRETISDSPLNNTGDPNLHSIALPSEPIKLASNPLTQSDATLAPIVQVPNAMPPTVQAATPVMLTASTPIQTEKQSIPVTVPSASGILSQAVVAPSAPTQNAGSTGPTGVQTSPATTSTGSGTQSPTAATPSTPAQNTGSTVQTGIETSPAITSTGTGTQNPTAAAPQTPTQNGGFALPTGNIKEALADELFPKPKGFGFEKFSVTCSNDIIGAQWVTFGLPFPRGELESGKRIRIERLDGTEVAADASELAYWRHFKDTSKDGKWIRSALIVFSHDCTNAKSAEYRFRWGTDRTLHAASNINPKNVASTWGSQAAPMPNEHPATDNYQRDALAPPILEPKVWVTLPSNWLVASNIRGPSRTDSLPDLKKYRLEFAKTYVNDVAADVIKFDAGDNGQGLIDWSTEFEGWLYDRPLALSDIYVATGDIKWLKHTHRAAQYYASWIAVDNSKSPYKRGSFLKTKANDLKYSLNGGLFSAYLLTGDARLIDKITAVADFALTYPTRLLPATKTTGLWTERHLATTISGLVHAYETTGSAVYKNRVLEIIGGMSADVQSPPTGYPSSQEMAGVLFHRFEVHEGTSRKGWNDLYMSPWMSALLGESLWKYFMLSDDSIALGFLSDYSKFVAEKGIFEQVMNDPVTKRNVPFHAAYYGLGIIQKGDWEGIFTQREHALDVAGLIARGRWASKKLGRPTSIHDQVIPQLFRTAMSNFPFWTRPTVELPRSRLSPTRKFAWWFGSTHDFSWFSPEGK
jgi:hypothetical protein